MAAKRFLFGAPSADVLVGELSSLIWAWSTEVACVRALVTPERELVRCRFRVLAEVLSGIVSDGAHSSTNDGTHSWLGLLALLASRSELAVTLVFFSALLCSIARRSCSSSS